jgi:hypothetical protein
MIFKKEAVMKLSGILIAVWLGLAPAMSFGQVQNVDLCDTDPTGCGPMDKPTPSTGTDMCDLTDLKCDSISNKCDIKFRNLTGKAENKCRYGKSISAAKTVTISTLWDSAPGTVQTNSSEKFASSRSILAGDSLTINIGKRIAEGNALIADGKLRKNGILRLRVRTNDAYVDGLSLKCEDIRAILKNNKTCKIYYDEFKNDREATGFAVVVDCNGNNLCWPAK